MCQDCVSRNGNHSSFAGFGNDCQSLPSIYLFDSMCADSSQPYKCLLFQGRQSSSSSSLKSLRTSAPHIALICHNIRSTLPVLPSAVPGSCSATRVDRLQVTCHNSHTNQASLPRHDFRSLAFTHIAFRHLPSAVIRSNMTAR
jgi:hypothetical protein